MILPLCLILSTLVGSIRCFRSDEHPNFCPGLYCGRTLNSLDNISDCGPCPKGSQRNDDFICEPCAETPSFYVWLYLGFMAMLTPGFHWFFIEFLKQRSNYSLFFLHLSALLECVLAGIFTLLVTPPLGSWSLTSCPVSSLSDWYPVFYNPTTDYVHTIHCTYEVVYPLYTIVMVYYAFCLLFLFILRPMFTRLAKLKVRHHGSSCTSCGTRSMYAALYALPMFIVIQAILGGLIYYAFPYILLLLSLITNALHFARFEAQRPMRILDELRKPRNLVVLLSHWILHGYAIVGITGFTNLAVHVPLLCLVPFPAIFYILTVHYTNPTKLEKHS